MAGQEFEGKSIDEALELARTVLGRALRPGEYEIVADGKRGFLGIGSRRARIRVVTAIEEAARSQPLDPPPSAGPGKVHRRSKEPPPSTDPSSRPGPGRGRRRSTGPRSATGQGTRRSGEPPSGSGNRRSEQAARGTAPSSNARRDVQSRSSARTPPASGAAHEEGARQVPRTPGDLPDRRHEALREVAGRILNGLKLDLTARLHDRDDTVFLELGGHDSQLLLDDDGEGLDALQHILNKILSRDERFAGRVVTECEGFRERRDEAIVARALRGAEEAKRTGKSVDIDGLNAYERRLVHMALAEEGGVHSFSTGEGAVKRLTIEPGAK